MATISRENIGLLNDRITVSISKDDYYPAFEQQIKSYAKKANIPGFRKGMVPGGMIKKMYGSGIFTEEILKKVEKELNEYMAKEKVEIFAQPLPLESDARRLDMNNPADYTFAFEIGLKPEIDINLSNINVTRHKVEVTDAMVDEELERLKSRNSQTKDAEVIDSEENVLTLQFTASDADGNTLADGIDKSSSFPVKYLKEEFRTAIMGKKKDDEQVIQLKDAFEEKEIEFITGDLGIDKNEEGALDKYFKLTITKIATQDPPEMDDAFYGSVFPGKNIAGEEEFRDAIKEQIQLGWDAQSNNQLHDQIYQHLLDHTNIEFPEGFLKRWMQNGGEEPKTAEDAEKEYPAFVNSLKWTLISTQLMNQNDIKVEQHELKQQAKLQVLSYMGGQSLDEAPWLDTYAESMLKDKKFVENTYYQLQTNKLFTLLESKVNAKEDMVTADELTAMQHQHSH